MTARKFDPARAVEIVAPRYGSGYRIGGGIVLTAAHLLPSEVGASCKVRRRTDAGEAVWEGKVAWLPSGLKGPDGPPEQDVALLTLGEEAGGWEPAMLGRLPEASRVLQLHFDLFGWPEWGQTKLRNAKSLAGGRHVVGVIYLSDTSGQDLLVLEPMRRPDPEVGHSASAWGGISGAAVVCGGLVVAVQRQHQNPQRSGSLEAVSLARFAGDSELQRVLTSAGIDASWPTAQPSSTGFSGFSELLKQLDDGAAHVRLGAIRSLERIAAESDGAHGPIMEALAAYIRQQRGWQEQRGTPPSDAEFERRLFVNMGGPLGPSKQYPEARLPTDLQAAATALGMRPAAHDPPGFLLDLSLVNLRTANLRGADFRGALLIKARLEGVDFTGANLEGADLRRARLRRAVFRDARLSGAQFDGARLGNALFWDAKGLAGATFLNAYVDPRRHVPDWVYWPDGFDPIAAGAIEAEDDEQRAREQRWQQEWDRWQLEHLPQRSLGGRLAAWAAAIERRRKEARRER